MSVDRTDAFRDVQQYLPKDRDLVGLLVLAPDEVVGESRVRLFDGQGKVVIQRAGKEPLGEIRARGHQDAFLQIREREIAR
ncbi:hypothetical protein C2L71_03255 [Enteroscipio rubneri]|uniref:Uncharacterized protein n=1 Tax=Enteroscipio rubneri TaxID=2070686 RepID=A0A2K2UD81_9ACTN|nr:hypothetical protein C2L71_03255 [Enteroscipio rubneri]